MRKLIGQSILLPVLLTIAINAQAQNSKSPNIIVVLADDIGVGDISSYRRLSKGQIVLETPNIDKLSEQGVMFTNAHAPAALCATSRYAIMTGQSCYRSSAPWGVWGAYNKSAIEPNQLTLGRLMKQANYQTAFLGKWHLGTSFAKKDDPNEIFVENRGKPSINVDLSKIISGGPESLGFDYSFCLPAGIQSVPYLAFENSKWFPLKKDSEIGFVDKIFMERLGLELEKKEGLGDSNWNPKDIGPLLANKAVDYIKAYAKSKQPFFMYYCSQAVHTPHAPIDELNGIKIAGTTPSKHMDMIKELDVQVGMMVDELKKQGIYENTVFIFTSDNGGLHVDGNTWNAHHEPSDIYRGAKNDPYEGGHRVPFIVAWPEKVKSQLKSSKPVLGLDIMATLASITNQNEDFQDSFNLEPIITNKKNKHIAERDFLIVQGGSRKERTIIKDGWKLIVQYDKKDKTDKTKTPVALFDLNTNLTEDERYNLIHNKKYKTKVNDLFRLFNNAIENKTSLVDY